MIALTNSNSPSGSGSISMWQSPNWPRPPVCFLWRPWAFARAADRLLVGHPRRLERDLGAEAALHPVDDHLDVDLRQAGHDLLAGLLVAVQVDRRVLLLQAPQGGVDLVVVALVLGLHGEGHDRRRELDPRHVDRLVARREPVAGVGLLELGDRADVARPERVGVADVLAARHQQLADALLVMGARVHDLRVVGHRALVDAEEVDAARERVGARLEHVGEHLALGIGLEREALLDLDAAVLDRARAGRRRRRRAGGWRRGASSPRRR